MKNLRYFASKLSYLGFGQGYNLQWELPVKLRFYPLHDSTGFVIFLRRIKNSKKISKRVGFWLCVLPFLRCYLSYLMTEPSWISTTIVFFLRGFTGICWYSYWWRLSTLSHQQWWHSGWHLGSYRIFERLITFKHFSTNHEKWMRTRPLCSRLS